MCCIFWFTVAGEDPFLVSLNAIVVLASLEIRKIPNLLTNKMCKFIKHLVICPVIFYLIFFSKHSRFDIMESGNRIGAVLGHHKRFIWAAFHPSFELSTQFCFSGFKVTAITVPAIITVECENIKQLGNFILIRG